MCIAATTAPTARRRTSLLYEQHKRKAKFRWNVVKLLFALLVVWYVKWTTKTVLEGTDGTYGEMDEDISAASSHRRKNHPVSLQKANEDYASNDDYSSSSSHDKNTQTTTDYDGATSEQQQQQQHRTQNQQKSSSVPDALPAVRTIPRPICGAHNQPCAHGTCNDDETMCTCSKIYVGDLCDSPIKLSGKKLGGSLLQSWNLPYTGPIIMSKYNLGKHMNTRKTGVLQLDLPNEVPRFLGPIGPPLLKILPSDDIFRGNRLFFPTCAVIGNSGSMKSRVNRNRAAEIDAHTVVIRFNDAKTDSNYGDIVGRKTSMRVVNAKHFGFRETEDEFVVQQMRSPQAFRSFMGEHRRNPGTPLYSLHPDFASYVIKSFPKIQTSVGFQGVLMALMSCGTVNVYGFSLGPNEGFSQSYYRPDSDEDLDADDDSSRNAEAQMLRKREQTEWKALSAMNGAGLITFRDKCVENCHVSRSRCGQCMKKQEKVITGEVDDVDDGDENSGSNDDEDGSSENDVRAEEEA